MFRNFEKSPPDKDFESQKAKRHRFHASPNKIFSSDSTTVPHQNVNIMEMCSELIKCNRELIKRNEQLIKILAENGLMPPQQHQEKIATEPISYSNVLKRTNNVHRSEVRKSNNNTSECRRSTVKRNEIPPIVVEDNGNRQGIWKEVLKITDKVSFCPINSKRYKIIVMDNLENHSKVLAYVKGAGMKGNTYTPKDEKPITLLVRNLEYVDAINEETIKNEYKNSGVNVLKAVKWSTKTMASKDKFFWLLQFHSKTDITKLNEKNLILNVVVRYEKPMSKLRIMQCRNCKRFEHAKSSCFNDFRCIKCPDKHDPGKCELPDASKPYCCNCETLGHPANSPNCPVYFWLLSGRKTGTNSRAA